MQDTPTASPTRKAQGSQDISIPFRDGLGPASDSSASEEQASSPSVSPPPVYEVEHRYYQGSKQDQDVHHV